MRQVVILHGWSDSSKSFRDLSKLLKTSGYNAVPIWLGDYISLDDDVSVKDVAKRMKAVVEEMLASGELTAPFDMIVHSTGGLVAREWAVSCCSSGEGTCPAKRLIMLAPANFGSRLASMGQSMLGRLVKGWDNWFCTGKRMLQNLELASPYQWGLVERDLLSIPGSAKVPSPYGEGGVWPFVIVGTQPYSQPLRSILNEDGADGTVRVCAANMNVKGATIDFSANADEDPVVTPWKKKVGRDWTMPLAVLPDQDHGSITNPKTDSELAGLILEALRCEDLASYKAIVNSWGEITERTARRGLVDPADANSAPATGEKSVFHQFMQVNVHVVDDHGEDVPDFFLEFLGPDGLPSSNRTMAYFHNEVLQHVHVNSQNPAYRCLYVDRTDLFGNFYSTIPEGKPKKLWMSISAAPLGDNVTYFKEFKTGAKGIVLAHQLDSADLAFRLKRNSTHFIKIIIPRTPGDKVFKLARA